VALEFVDIAIDREDGDKLYISGRLIGLEKSDTLCVMYSRPGGGGLRNLKGDRLEYTFINRTSGGFNFASHNKYLEFSSSGDYILEAWDVGIHCGDLICKRVDYTLSVVRVEPLAFADVAISRRYGDRLCLAGKLEHLVVSDEICVMYSRPGGGGLRNLKGSTLDYTYLKDAFGQVTFETRGKYLEFSSSGYYILEAWDVSGNCETRSQKRADWFLKVTQPKYQYQLIFDVSDPALGGNAYLLQAEWDKYNAYKPYGITTPDPDCFIDTFGYNEPVPKSSESGWLCQAAEFLSSGCSPLPWWMCRSMTEWDVYMRGECSCAAFREGLGDLGIPCHHLIAVHERYAGEPPYCGYVKCD